MKMTFRQLPLTKGSPPSPIYANEDGSVMVRPGFEHYLEGEYMHPVSMVSTTATEGTRFEIWPDCDLQELETQMTRLATESECAIFEKAENDFFGPSDTWSISSKALLS